MNRQRVSFFHSPQCRSAGTRALPDELGAADVPWGAALNGITLFKLGPVLPAIRVHVDRVLARPAMQRAAAKDAELLAAQSA